MVWPGDRVTEEFAARVNSAFALGNQRTSAQDVEFAVHQLVEIAVRALSPGINDPFTAYACVDRLGSALCRLVQREMPSPYRFDGQGRLRVIVAAFTFPGSRTRCLTRSGNIRARAPQGPSACWK